MVANSQICGGLTSPPVMSNKVYLKALRSLTKRTMSPNFHIGVGQKPSQWSSKSFYPCTDNPRSFVQAAATRVRASPNDRRVT